MPQKPKPESSENPKRSYPMKQSSKLPHIDRRLVTAILVVYVIVSVTLPKPISRLFAAAKLSSVTVQAQDHSLSVLFPDAGSAGCALIYSSSGTVLIDCGKEKTQNNICTLLDDLGITTINAAVLTHPDSDHMGNYATVIEKYSVQRFITCEYSKGSDSKQYADIAKALTGRKIPIEYAAAGDVISLGAMRLDIISPDTMYKSSNDNSVVVKLSFGDFTALFPGDISQKAERDILESSADISADLLYVAHHGSKNSSSEEFLNAVSPKYAVISVAQSEYLPAGEAIMQLNKSGCEIYRTDISGLIAVCTNGEDSSTEIITQK